jgi:hypothetical protein
MEHIPSEVTDGFLIAAILQSDAAVRAIQRELKLVYPGLTVSSMTIRDVLRNAVLCHDLLNDERVQSARALLEEINALSAEVRRTRATGVFQAVSSDAEEHWLETLSHDMKYATGGG